MTYHEPSWVGGPASPWDDEDYNPPPRYGTDHETALAGGFDIVAPGIWVRPDNAAIYRDQDRYGFKRFYPAYIAIRADDRRSRFYTMTEAVEWIGGTR